MLMKCLHNKLISIVGLAICITLISSFAHAHEGLHGQIVTITAKIKRDPKNASLYLQRGELHRLDRNWTRAAADYDRAARLQPGLPIVDLARGRMLFESKRFQQAKLGLDRFLLQQPGHFEALITRARVLARIGMRLESAHDFTQALTIAAEPELFLERAGVLAGDEQYIQHALRGLDEGIKRLGPLVTLELAAIDLELRRKNYEAALNRLDLITAQSERKEMWLVRRGEILKVAGRSEEARIAFSAALAAIELLPPERRQNRATTALQSRARAGSQ